jgi:hypothetical protein
MGRRDPEILAARESSERDLMRWRRWFGERGSGVEEETKGYLHPDPSFYRLTIGVGNSGPGGRIFGPSEFSG